MKKSSLAIFGISLYLVLVSATAMGQQTNLVSVNNTGVGGGNDTSLAPAISDDGRYVAFGSRATDLVPNDNNGKNDVFLRDTVAGTTTLVSATPTGESGNEASGGAVISANGQFVAFTSKASNLVSNDNNNAQDIFVRNLLTGVTSLVSVNASGIGSANSVSYTTQISADGRYVAFMSIASDIVPNDTNGYAADIFVRDMQTGTTKLVSANINGGSGNTDTYTFALSANGHFIAFSSEASDLVLRDGNNRLDVFLRDLDAGTTSLVSVNRLGTRSGNNSSGGSLSISGDGRFVLFISRANNLTGNDTNIFPDVFVRDTVMRTTTLVSVNRDGLSQNGGNSVVWAALSQNGSKALFVAWDSDIVEHDENFKLDYFVRDLSAGTTQIISSRIPRAGTPLDELNFFTPPGISADGRFVVFCINRQYSTARKNVYVRDLLTGRLTWVNPTTDYWGAEHPVISSDGQFVAFESYTGDLMPNATPNYGNVFLFHNAPPAVREETGRVIK